MAEKIIRVFVSSTLEDLQDERVAVKQAIEELNLSLAPWEIALVAIDLRSGARPVPPLDESLREVALSQVLIGIIGFRYGTVDQQTRKSICELEYDKACKCDIPALMYLRHYETKVPPHYMETDVESLSKLKTFTEKVEQRHKRDNFKTSDELRGHVLRDLPRTVLEKFMPSLQELKAQAVETPLTPQPQNKMVKAASKEEVSAEAGTIKDLLKSISANVSDLRKVDGKKKARLYLLAASMLYNTELPGTLGTHEIQRLYSERKKVDPLASEKMFLLKNVLSDEYGTKAGWFWWHKGSSKAVHTYLEWLCISERDKDVRIACLKLLKNFWSKRTEKIACESAKSNSKEVCMAALSVLEELGSEKCLRVLDEVGKREDTEIEKTVKRAKFRVLVRNNPDEALSLVTEFKDAEAILLQSELANALQVMNVADLKKLKKHPDEKISKIATQELVRKGKFDEIELKVLTHDRHPEVRYLAYKSLIEKGEKFDPDVIQKSWEKHGGTTLLSALIARTELRDEIIVKIFESYPVAELEKWIDWTASNGKLAYLVWGLHGGQDIIRQVRRDLKANFERIKQDCSAKLDQLLVKYREAGSEANVTALEKLIASINKYEDFTVSQFTESGLKILLQHGEKEDIALAKQFMKSGQYNIKGIAEELFVNLAGKDDLCELVDIALNESGEIKTKAARKALSIDEKNLTTEKFLKSNEPTLVKECLEKNLKDRQILEDRKIDELLRNDNNRIRVMTVSYLMKALQGKTKKLEDLLERYLKNETYYYDVVCWLDRILYAPRTFKIMFRKQLAEQLN